MYLEPIFCSEDIARQLPAEMKKYTAMERFWRRIMKTAADYPKVPSRPVAQESWPCLMNSSMLGSPPPLL